jgi:hypothetical protein
MCLNSFSSWRCGIPLRCNDNRKKSQGLHKAFSYAGTRNATAITAQMKNRYRWIPQEKKMPKRQLHSESEEASPLFFDARASYHTVLSLLLVDEDEEGT